MPTYIGLYVYIYIYIIFIRMNLLTSIVSSSFPFSLSLIKDVVSVIHFLPLQCLVNHILSTIYLKDFKFLSKLRGLMKWFKNFYKAYKINVNGTFFCWNLQQANLLTFSVALSIFKERSSFKVNSSRTHNNGFIFICIYVYMLLVSCKSTNYSDT